MTIQADRAEWGQNDPKVNEVVDVLVDVLQKHADAIPVAYMAVDTIYRPFLHWLLSARRFKCDATDARNSALHLINMMVMELAVRIATKGSDGKMPVDQWVGEFVTDLINELRIDVFAYEQQMNRKGFDS